MLRKVAVGISAIGLALSGVALTAGSAYAAKTPVNASGTLHCAITGKVKIAPPLVFDGTSGAATFIAKLKSTSCTGTSGVTSVKGTFTSVLPTNDCLALALAPFPAGTLSSTKYKGAAKYVANTVNFTSGGTFSSSDPITMDLPGGGTSSVSSGSFAGQHPAIHFVYDQPTLTFATNCQVKTKGVKGSGGLKKMSFAGLSSFDIG